MKYSKAGRLFKLGAFLGLSFVFNACSNRQPETFVTHSVDSFRVYRLDSYTQASELLQADYIFSVDYSWSMGWPCTVSGSENPCHDEGDQETISKRGKLFNSMDAFSAALIDEEIDYRIGIVQGSKQSGAPEAAQDFVHGLMITTALASGLEEVIRAKTYTVGFPLEANETMVLKAANNVAHNRGDFFRDAAQLVYIFVTDNDDISSTTAQEYAKQMSEVKSNNDYVSARAIISGYGDDCSPQRDLGEAKGERVFETVARINSGRMESSFNLNNAEIQEQNADDDKKQIECIISNTDFSGILDSLARNVTRPTQRFKVQGAFPIESTIRVFVNDLEIARDTGRWSYNASSNEVIFKEDQEPNPEASLEIRYDQDYKLSSPALKESITVNVNGSPMEESSSNGWSYEEGSRRIVFHGSAVPANGSVIRVNYRAL